MVTMITKNQLEQALKDAMRASDDVRKRVLRQALSSIRLAEIDKGSALDDAGLLSILQKEAKSYQETYDESVSASRLDLAEKARAEMEVIQEFLPQQLSQDELESLVKQAIAEVGATSLREMGQVMKALMPRLQGRATGDQASYWVKKLLS
jgi:uncharacterized protein YqeY